MFEGQAILTSIEFQMSLLLFVALGGYLVAYRINQSAVVGIILAGMVVGPSLLGLVTYTDFVASLAHLGAVVLLFTIGLEFEIRQIAKLKFLIIALFGVLVPWVAGFYLAAAFSFDFKTSVFIGTALTATSIAITANVLREMGKLQSKAAQAIIGAAVIDDVLALLALTVSEGLVLGTLALVPILVTVAKAVGFMVVGVMTGTLLVKRLMTSLDNAKISDKYPESIFIFAIMVAFFYAMAAQLVGLSAIVGSFLAGVTLASTKLTHGHSFKEGSEHLQIIFASIFFVSLGVLVDLHMLTLRLLLFVVVLTVVAGLTKIIGCGVPSKLQGLGMRDSLIIGVGMMPRGEVAMIVALIGLTGNLISQETYGAIVLMSLFTTVFPPFILRNWLFKAKKP